MLAVSDSLTDRRSLCLVSVFSFIVVPVGFVLYACVVDVGRGLRCAMNLSRILGIFSFWSL